MQMMGIRAVQIMAALLELGRGKCGPQSRAIKMEEGTP